MKKLLKNSWVLVCFIIIVSTNPMKMRAQCSAPINLSVSAFTHSATVSYDFAGNAPEYGLTIALSEDGGNTWSTKTNGYSSGSKTYEITGLTPGSDYIVRLASNCMDGKNPVQSAWVEKSFSTQELPTCDPLTLSWAGEAFDSPTAIDYCWTKGKSNPDFSGVHTTESQRVGSMGYGIDFGSTKDGYTYLALPELDYTVDVAQLTLNFMAKVTALPATRGIALAGVMDDPTDFETFQVVDTLKFSSTNWEEKNIALASYGGGSGKYITLVWLNGEGHNLCIDNVTLSETTSCASPNVSVLSVTAHEAQIWWSDPVNGGWQALCLPTGTTPDWENDNPVNLDGSNNYYYTFTQLNSLTNYTLYFKADCEGVIRQIDFTTEAQIASIPYFCNFEDETENGEWVLHGGSTNFYIGLALNHGGLQCLYVSNDNGVSNAHGLTSYIYAARGLNVIDSAQYEISFDLKSNGHKVAGNGNSVSAFLIPGDKVPDDYSAGMVYSSHVPLMFHPDWIVLENEIITTTWITKTYTTNLKAGHYQLMFYWRSDNTSDQPPAAIDNIQVLKNTCAAKASNLTATSPTTNSITLSWESDVEAQEWEIEYGARGFIPGTGTSEILDAIPTTPLTGLQPSYAYDLYARAICAPGDTGARALVAFNTLCGAIEQLPYQVDFNNIATNEIPVCWARDNSAGSTSGSKYGTTGMGIDFGASSNTLVLPAMSTDLNTLSLHFMARLSGSGVPQGIANIGIVTAQNNFASFVQVATLSFSACNQWEEKWVNLAPYSGTGSYIAIQYTGTSGQSFHLDDLEVLATPACSTPAGLTVTGTDSHSITFSWDDATHTDWQLLCLPQGEIPDWDNSGNVQTLNESEHGNSFTIENLDGGTSYMLYLRADCGGDYSIPAATLAKTLPAPATLPYTCNFENNLDNKQWELLNGNLPDQWFVGTAAKNGGSKGLYISSDNGEHNISKTNSANFTYAARTFMVEYAGEYEMGFDWKCVGDVDTYLSKTGETENIYYALGYAYLVPDFAYTGIAAGNAYNFCTQYMGCTPSDPSGWIRLGNLLYDNNTWTRVNEVMELSAGTYHLVFVWKRISDGSLHDPYQLDEPLAIDNVSIKSNNCPIIAALNVSSLAPTAFTITWTNPTGNENTEYQMQYGDKGFTLNENNIEYQFADTSYVFDVDIEASHEYDIYVRPVCDADLYGSWQKITVSTPCPLINEFPYIETFETTSNDNIPSCWNRFGAGSEVPKVSDATTNIWTCYGQPFYANNSQRGINMGKPVTESILVLPGIDENVSLDTLTLTFDFRRIGEGFSPGKTELGTFAVGFMENPSNPATFTALESNIVPSADKLSEECWGYGVGSDWETLTIPLASYTGSGRYLAFKWSAASMHTISIDNVKIIATQECMKPQAMHLEHVGSDSVSVTWTDGSINNAWQIACLPQGTDIDWDEATEINEKAMSFNNLTPDMSYVLWLRAHCGDDDYSNILTYAFTTNSTAATVPYIYGFEDDTENSLWHTANFLPADKKTCWIIGSATAKTGTKSLYISYDGLNPGENSNSWNYAYRDITFPEDGTYEFLFDLKFKAFAFGDPEVWVKAFLLPTTFIPEDLTGNTYNSSQYGMGIGKTGAVYTVNGWHDATGVLSGEEEWVNWGTAAGVQNVAAGTYRFTICYHKDNTIGFPPIVDNVVIRPYTCAPAENIYLSPTSNSIALSWTGDAGLWEIEYGAKGFTQGTGMIDTAAATLKVLENLDADTDYDLYLRAICGEDDTSRWIKATTKTLIGCSVPSNLQVVGVPTSSSVDLTWVPGNEENKWEVTYTPVGSTNDRSFFVSLPACNIGSLNSSTSYSVRVRAVCSDESNSAYSTPVEFMTAPGSCDAPAEVAVTDSTHAGATITWLPGTGEHWEIAHKKATEGEEAWVVQITTNNPYTITNLEAATTYNARVRTQCSTTDFSDPVYVNFTTKTTPVAVHYTLTPSVNNPAWGSITPDTAVTVNEGDSFTFTFAPNPGYKTWEIKIDNQPVSNGETARNTVEYTFTNVNQNHSIEIVFEKETGIANILPAENMLKIFPNPVTNGTLTIENAPWKTQNTIEIYNLTGQKLLTLPLEQKTREIDVNLFPAGMYLLKIGEQTTKFVKE
ncbi:MAG: fibronectin type III domain-containing protein [Bacteroidales bacterium]|jgi:hypothetical protein|nr:fibronectin type III domain-containing protein [Bacteroidales bacterium]